MSTLPIITFDMKTKFIFRIILTCFILLSSCQNSVITIESDNSLKEYIELSAEEVASVSFNDTTKLTDKEVIDILKTHINYINTPIASSTSLTIDNISRIFVKSPASLLYEIDFNLNGEHKAIVSGDKRFPYVLATFRPNTSNDEDDTDIAPIVYAKNLLTNNVRQIEHIKDSLYRSTKEKIRRTFGKDFDDLTVEDKSNLIRIKDSSTSRATIITNPPSDAIAGNGPFITVSWNCGMPYNQLMPQTCSDNWLWDYRYPISSSVVAVAQILSYIRPTMTINGITINWKYLCEKEEIHDTSDYFGTYVKDPEEKCSMIAQLMKYVGDQCNVSYSCNSSSVYPQKIIDFFNRYKIHIDNGQNLDVTKLKSSIDELRPVLMYGQDSNGGGHWWVVDGYRTQVATRGTFFPGYNVYMHANMGKGKSYNGYYLVDSNGSLTFDTQFAHFNKNLKMYGNIYK